MLQRTVLDLTAWEHYVCKSENLLPAYVLMRV